MKTVNKTIADNLPWPSIELSQGYEVKYVG